MLIMLFILVLVERFPVAEFSFMCLNLNGGSIQHTLGSNIFLFRFVAKKAAHHPCIKHHPSFFPMKRAIMTLRMALSVMQLMLRLPWRLLSVVASTVTGG